MLKPTGSAGGGSSATSAAQATTADTPHNRTISTPKLEERRGTAPSFADEISSKPRWSNRAISQDRGGGSGGGGRGRKGGPGGAWEPSRERGLERGGNGEGGRGYERERGARDDSQDGNRRGRGWGQDTSRNNTSRNREAMYGSNMQGGMANADETSVTRTLTTTYVRQHGPPPRKLQSSAAAATQGKTQAALEQERAPVTTPTASSARSASTPSAPHSSTDPWSAPSSEQRWRNASSPTMPQSTEGSDASPALDGSSSHSGAYSRSHGPPVPRGSREPAEEYSKPPPESSAGSDLGLDTGDEGCSRSRGPWQESEEERHVTDRDDESSGERPLNRWKEPSVSLTPATTGMDMVWKESRGEPIPPRHGTRRSTSTGREVEQVRSEEWSGDGTHPGDLSKDRPVEADSPSRCPPWKGSSRVGWRLQAIERHDDADMLRNCPDSRKEAEVEHALKPETKSSPGAADAQGSLSTLNAMVEERPATTVNDDGSEDSRAFRKPFVTQPPPASQPVLPPGSWEPQLQGSDNWSAASHGHGGIVQGDGHRQERGSSRPGASQFLADPWATTTFGLPSAQDRASSAIASLLGAGSDETGKNRYLSSTLQSRGGNQDDQRYTAGVPTRGDGENDSSPGGLHAGIADMAAREVSASDLTMTGGSGEVGSQTTRAGERHDPVYDSHK